MSHLDRYMKVWIPNKVSRIKTPNGLGYALAYGGGVTNTIVQLVNIDRCYLENIKTKLNESVEKLKLYMSRVNQIYYMKPTSVDEQVDDNTFTFKASAFTGITRQITFYIDITKGTATPDAITLARINALMISENENLEIDNNNSTIDETNVMESADLENNDTSNNTDATDINNANNITNDTITNDLGGIDVQTNEPIDDTENNDLENNDGTAESMEPTRNWRRRNEVNYF